MTIQITAVFSFLVRWFSQLRQTRLGKLIHYTNLYRIPIEFQLKTTYGEFIMILLILERKDAETRGK